MRIMARLIVWGGVFGTGLLVGVLLAVVPLGWSDPGAGISGLDVRVRYSHPVLILPDDGSLLTVVEHGLVRARCEELTPLAIKQIVLGVLHPETTCPASIDVTTGKLTCNEAKK